MHCREDHLTLRTTRRTLRRFGGVPQRRGVASDVGDKSRFEPGMKLYAFRMRMLGKRVPG